MLTAIKFALFAHHDPSFGAFCWTRFWNAPSKTRREAFWLYFARRS